MPADFEAALQYGNLGMSLDVMEHGRRQYRHRQLWKAGIAAMLGLLLGFAVLWCIKPIVPGMHPETWGVYRLAGFIVAGVLLVYALVCWSGFRSSMNSWFRQEAVLGILATLVDEPHYNPGGQLAEHEFRSMGLCDGWDAYSGSEYMSGCYKGVPFAMAEFALEREDEDEDGDTEMVVYAHGTALIAVTGSQ
jgi:hypothetical protein